MSLEHGLLRRDHLTQEWSQHRRKIGAPGRLRSHGDMIGIALSYVYAYRRYMPTNITEDRLLHRIAVLQSIDVVNTVREADLVRPTPCEDWDLLDLLAHMTVQHRGFAAAARIVGRIALPPATR